jgi:hypothetical protein
MDDIDNSCDDNYSCHQCNHSFNDNITTATIIATAVLTLMTVVMTMTAVMSMTAVMTMTAGMTIMRLILFVFVNS